MNERTGGQLAQMCIDRGSGFELVDVTNFEGEIFAREYVADDPQVNVKETEESLISTQINNTPLWTSNINPQNCTIGELDWCIVEYEVFASGEVNETYSVFLQSASNYSQVSSQESVEFSITITEEDLPEITLLQPINNEKILSAPLTEFNFTINGSSSQYICELYINEIFNISKLCSNAIMNSFFQNISKVGTYNYSIQLLDNSTNSSLIQSNTRIFTKLIPYHRKVSKKMNSLGSQLYEVDINTTNINSFTQTIGTNDVVSEGFLAGTSSPPTINSTNISGMYSGDLLQWRSLINSSDSTRIMYPVSRSNTSKHILDIMIIGLD
ncbi:MAG: hypothetical protein ACLFPL_01575 [Candidatus Nanoarchaeia archaeon]